jgi:hypothetical protein
MRRCMDGGCDSADVDGTRPLAVAFGFEIT